MSRLIPSLTNISLNRKNSKGTNSLAYFGAASRKMKNSFIRFAPSEGRWPEVGVLTLFFFDTVATAKYARLIVLAKYFQASLIFGTNILTYTSGARSWLLALLPNIKLVRKCSARTNSLAYFAIATMPKKKSVLAIETRSPKMFGNCATLKRTSVQHNKIVQVPKWNLGTML